MANQFSTLKNNQAVEKFSLVRIEPARFVNDDLTDIGGGKYSISLTGFVISRVSENDTALSYATSGPAIGEYTFNESTGLLTIYPNTAPGVSNSIIVYYYLFYTSWRSSVVYQDPENTSTTLRYWRPRIKSGPNISTSIRNVLSGVLTISASNIKLINDDGDLNAYFSANDSWYKKNIKAWVCLNDTENIQKVYEGTVAKVDVDSSGITLRIEDSISNFDVPAFMGDDRSENYVTKGDYANVYPNRANSTIPFMFGTVSRYQTIPETVTNLTMAQKIDPGTLYSAICIDYTTDLTTSNNRQWLACRTADGYLDFGCTPSNVDNSDGNFTRLDVTAGEAAKFHIGDTFTVAAGPDVYVRVYYVDRTNNYVYVTKDATIVTTDVVEGNEMPTVVITNDFDQTYYLLYERDYTITETSTSGGNKLYRIDLVNNFEVNHAGLTVLDPGAFFVKFRMKPDTTNAKHGSVLQKLLESLGLTVNAASIAAANIALTSNCNFSIPQFDEIDFKPYFRYIELLLSSTFGYIYLNNSFEIAYALFDTPSSSSVLDDGHILKDSFKLKVEYKDIITQLIGYNIHYAASEVTSLAATPSVTETSNKARYLHGLDSTVRFRHILEDMSSRLSDIMNFRSERIVTYNFSTATINLDSLVGDDFKLENSGLLGDDTSRQITLIGIDKSTNLISISAIDLIGV